MAWSLDAIVTKTRQGVVTGRSRVAVRKDGTIIGVLLGVSTIVDEAGVIVGVASTSRPLKPRRSPTSDPRVPHEDRETAAIQPQVVNTNHLLDGMIASAASGLGDEMPISRSRRSC